MSEEIELVAGIKVPKSDWDATPVSVRVAVSSALSLLSEQINQLKRENQQLSERVSHLEEKLQQNSQNSSQPPSRDGIGKQVKEPNPSKRKQSRPGSESKPAKELYPIELCQQVHEQVPRTCEVCGEALTGVDVKPYRHQVIELPPVTPAVIEYRLHQLSCEHCGSATRGSLPPQVSRSGYGERLAAVVALLSGEYRQSHRMVQSLMQVLFNVRLSRGSVNRLRCEVSEAVSAAVDGALSYVQSQDILHSDETSFKQGNGDKLNPTQSQGWLWVLVTPLVSFFEVVLSRSGETAQTLIGKDYTGIVVSDRYSSYCWIELHSRQVCWAHLKRDFTAIAQRKRVSTEIGEALLFRERRLFRWWHRVRDGTLSREDFIALVNPLRAGLKAQLQEAANLPIGEGEKTPLAKTIRTAQTLLKVEAAF
jgi:transposase